MKILVLCVVVSALVAISLAGPVKINRVKDTDDDSSSSESSETFAKKLGNTKDSSSESVEDQTVVVKDNDNNAKEVESSEEEEKNDKKKTHKKNNNIVKDDSGNDSSDSTENDVKTKEYVLVIDEDLHADIRHKRAIRPDADTHNHILSNDLARMENEKFLKLKRARRDASSEEDSSEEKHKHKDGEIVHAAKPATAEASTLEGHAVVAEKPAEAEASSPAEEGHAVVAEKPAEAEATASRRRRSTSSSEESSEETIPEVSVKSRKRRNTSASSEENSSEEKGKTGDAAKAEKDAHATTHKHEHAEGAATETKHEEAAETKHEEAAEPKHEEPAARRRRDTSMESSEENLEQEVADTKLDDYEEIIISLSGEEKEQPTLQDTSTNVENGKYYILIKDPRDGEDVQNENIDIKLKSGDKDNSDEDYVKGCEGNDANNDSSEWNETTYVE